MSDHVWSQENIAAYVLGGLEPAEAERLEHHAAQCAACAQAVDETRALERKLAPWFSAADPGPALEDRVIQSLPPATARGPFPRLSGKVKAVLFAAAGLLLAVVGAGASVLIDQDYLAFPAPAQEGAVSQNSLNSLFSYLGISKTRAMSDKNQRGSDVLMDAEQLGDRAPKSARELAEKLREDAATTVNGELHKLHMSIKGIEEKANMGPAVSAEYSDEARRLTRDHYKVEVQGKTSPSAFTTTDGTSNLNGPARWGFSDAQRMPVDAPSEPARAGANPTLNMPPIKGPGSSTTSEGIAGGGTVSLGFVKDSKAGEEKVTGLVAPSLRPNSLTQAVNRPLNNTSNLNDGLSIAGGAGGKKSEIFWRYSNTGQLPPLGIEYFKPADVFAREQGLKELDSKDISDLAQKKSDVSGPDPSAPEVRAGAKADKAEKKPAAEAPPANPPPPQTPQKIIIRSGELEFEIDSFDASVATIMRLVTATRGGFVATVNSDKLANGKVRGSVMVRMPPEQLDNFVLDLRKELGKTGELKNQRIGSRDITKEFTDLESRLRAARTMEERLLRIIKEGKGQIKDLLLAETELGKWRTKIEEMEGELRFYANQVSLSSLTINLTEKEIRTAASVTENERVVASLQTEDVEKAHQEALKAITDFKGRVTRSEVKQQGAGQFTAILHFEVTPDATGPMRDRLRQLGTMVGLQIDRLQHTSNNGPAPKEGKIEHGNTQFIVSIYNLAMVGPRETLVLRIAAADVPAVYLKLREIVATAKGKVLNAQLNEQDRQNLNAQLDFFVNRLGASEVQAALGGAGETLSRQVNRVPENDNVTDAKVLYRITLVDADSIQPRETVTMRIAATDVPAAYQKLREALAKAKARVVNAQLNEQDRRNITGQLDFAFRRSDEAVLRAALAAAGQALSRQVTRLPESANVTDAKVVAHVELIDADSLPPRHTVILKIAAADVAAAYESVRAAVAKAKGRVGSEQLNAQDQRNVTALLVFDMPKSEEAVLQSVLAGAGEALTRQMTRKEESNSVTDTRVGFHVDFLPAAGIPPRETTVLGVEVGDVRGTLTLFNAQVNEVHGRVLKTDIGQEKNGQVTAVVIFDVPLSDAAALVEKFKAAGQVRLQSVSRDSEAPEGKLALGRIVVTLTNMPLLVPSDQGLWSQIRGGVAFSLRGLAISASWLIVGLLFVLPWVLLLYLVFWLTRRMWRGVSVAEGRAVSASGNVPTP